MSAIRTAPSTRPAPAQKGPTAEVVSDRASQAGGVAQAAQDGFTRGARVADQNVAHARRAAQGPKAPGVVGRLEAGGKQNMIRRAEDASRQMHRGAKLAKSASNGLAVLGAAANGVHRAKNGVGGTPEARMLEGALAGGLNFAINKLPGGSYVAALDSVTGGNVSGAYNGFAAAVVGVGSSIADKNARALESFSDRAQRNDYGKVVGGFARAGDRLGSVAADAYALGARAVRGVLGWFRR